MASKILKPGMHDSRIGQAVQWLLTGTQRYYQRALEIVLTLKWLVVALFFLLIAATAWLATALPNEYTPQEDRGNFIVLVNGPEGATFDYMMDYMDEIEARLTPLVDNGELERIVVRAPRGFGNIENFNSGFIIVNMADWGAAVALGISWPIFVSSYEHYQVFRLFQ